MQDDFKEANTVSRDENFQFLKELWLSDTAIDTETNGLPLSWQNTAHYSSSWEIRTKGVGFFDFSHDSIHRAQQLESLRLMRAQTQKSRTIKNEATNSWREKRNIRQKRLAKISLENQGAMSSNGVFLCDIQQI